jgi:hypothetical protein
LDLDNSSHKESVSFGDAERELHEEVVPKLSSSDNQIVTSTSEICKPTTPVVLNYEVKRRLMFTVKKFTFIKFNEHQQVLQQWRKDCFVV